MVRAAVLETGYAGAGGRLGLGERPGSYRGAEQDVLTDTGSMSTDSISEALDAQTGQAGDAAVLLAHAGAVRRFCRSQLTAETDVDDAVQDTFVRFLQRPESRYETPRRG